MVELKALACGSIVLLALPAISVAGMNLDAKLAMHVVASDQYLTWEDLIPAACESINVDLSVAELFAEGGYGYVVLLAYDVEGISAVEFALSGWPTGRGAPQLSGLSWYAADALTFGDHLAAGGATGLGECSEPNTADLVPLAYLTFGPLDSTDVPIDFNFLPSTYTAPDDSLLAVADCTEGFLTDEVVAHSGCTIGGTYAGQIPDCGERAAGAREGSLRIARVIEITDGSVYCIDPSWSPDGSKVVFSHSQYQGIYIADADGKGPVVELTDAPYSGYSRQWTSDGKAMILSVRTGKRGHAIRAVDVETKQVRDLVTGLRSVGPLQRNRRGDIFTKANGRWMAVDERAGRLVEPREYYLAREGGGADEKMIEWKPISTVWIMNSDGSNRFRFPHEAGSPSLSPTGDKICFHWADLCVANLDGTGVVVLADEGYADGECWSPDGREIVFTVASDEDHWGNFNRAELFVANVDGSGTTQLTNTPDIRECLPSWSPDGTRIAYEDAKTGRIFVAVLERVQ